MAMPLYVLGKVCLVGQQVSIRLLIRQREFTRMITCCMCHVVAVRMKTTPLAVTECCFEDKRQLGSIRYLNWPVGLSC